MTGIKKLLASIDESQASLAQFCGISKSTLADIINHNKWLSSDRRNVEILEKTRLFLGMGGIDPLKIEQAIQELKPVCANTPDVTANQKSEEDEAMLLRRQTLTPEAKKLFGVLRNPFGDINAADDMWMSPDIRYVRESMLATAKHGGFLAVVGESGAGKTSVLLDFEDRIERDALPIIVIRPYVLAAEDNDRKGKTLKATHIAEALLRSVAPLATIKSSPEARFAQLHKALKDSHASGYRHCLVIEEAHSLPIPTLKHLKRILELQVGFTKLISIILIGQPELLLKLSERNHDVREVVQRCEVATLPAIETARIDEFLDHRFKRCGKAAGEVIGPDGLAALTELLVSTNGASQLYPLAVGNVLISAMNIAARVGVPQVTGDIIKEVVAGM